jgi:hypothetical protein
MRITITIEDDAGNVTTMPATAPPAIVGAMSDEGPAVGTPPAPVGSSAYPPADLLARAAAVGALSAGPAPMHPAIGGEPPFPPAEPGAPDAPGHRPGAEGDLPAGEAPQSAIASNGPVMEEADG